MRKSLSFISILLLVLMLVTSCAPTTPGAEDDTTPSEVVTTPAEMTTPTEDTQPTPEEIVAPPTAKLPIPFIDIDFNENGDIYDSAGRVTCLLANEANGSVVNKAVVFDGKKYTVPHFEVRKSGGVAYLRYNGLENSDQLLAHLKDGFTMEAFLVNHKALASTDNEQCMVSSCQSGGYNFTTHKGQYKFSVYTDGSYKNPYLNSEYDTTELTHLVGIYDPASQTSSLYVNGVFVSEIATAGTFTLGKDDAWKTIVLGGDVNGSGGATTLCESFEITDFKLYTQAAQPYQARVMYESAVSELTGAPLDYKVLYTDVIPDDTALFKTLAESYVTDVYEPTTSLGSSPTILQYASADLIDVARNEKRPATVIFGVALDGKELYATDRDGKPLGNLYNTVKALETKVIPAFVVTPATAAALQDFINENRIGDCFVIGTDKEILKKINDSTVAARPVLDLRGIEKVDPADAYLSASYCGSKVVLADMATLNDKIVLDMRSRSLAVFVDPSATTAGAINNAVAMGAAGIATTDYTKVIEYYETVTTPTLSMLPLIVAHRGDIASYPHNVMSSFISAAKSGANVTELDVWLTADDHLVLNHDAETNGFDKKLTCTKSTRKELKTLKSTSKYATAADEIAFYDELMDYFSKNYTDMIFIVEVKDKRNEVVDKIMEITKQYGMEDRILIICMTHSIVRYAYENYGIGIQMNQSYMLNKSDVKGSLAPACIECATLNTSFFTKWTAADQNFSDMLRHRGIKYSPWTTNSAQATDADYMAGYPEFTTNFPHQCDTYVRKITATVAADGTLTATRVNYDGTTQNVTSSVVLVPLSGNVTLADGKISGKGEFALRYETRPPLFNKKAYSVYSQTISY